MNKKIYKPIQVNDENYINIMSNNPLIIIKFTMDGCIPCLFQEKEFKKNGNKLINIHKGLIFSEVFYKCDGKCDKILKLCKIVAFPTIGIWINGNIYIFKPRVRKVDIINEIIDCIITKKKEIDIDGKSMKIKFNEHKINKIIINQKEINKIYTIEIKNKNLIKKIFNK